MNTFLLWQYIGWALLAIIVLGALWLMYALYADYQRNKTRDISLPSLDIVQNREKKEVFDSAPSSLVEGSSRSSRRSRRTEAKKDYQEAVATKSSAFFDDGDDEGFTLTHGRD